jgi:hypothetical protein
MTTVDERSPPRLAASHRQAEEARLIRRIESLEVHRRGLDRAIEPFGHDGLDPEKWRTAFTSVEPDNVVARSGVTGCYSALINGYVELIKTGAYLTGLTPTRRTMSATQSSGCSRMAASASSRLAVSTSSSFSRVGSSTPRPTSGRTKYERQLNYCVTTPLL